MVAHPKPLRYLDYVDRRVRRLVRAKRKLIELLNEQKQAIIHRASPAASTPTSASSLLALNGSAIYR